MYMVSPMILVGLGPCAEFIPGAGIMEMLEDMMDKTKARFFVARVHDQWGFP